MGFRPAQGLFSQASGSRSFGLGRDYTIWVPQDGNVKFDRAGRRVNVEPAAN
ncbi:MAG: hypothetical protein WCS31_09115 [Verrucomicrobiae bacterium]